MTSASAGRPLTRLAVVVSHPIQYYAPWFRSLAAEGRVELRVFHLSDQGVQARRDAQFGAAFAWDVDLLSGYASEFVPNRARTPSVNTFSGLWNPGLFAALRTWRPDAILLFGYAYRTHLALLGLARAPVIFRGDSHLLGGPPPTGLKRLALRLIFSRCAAFLPVGKANAAYFRHFGVSEDRLFPAPHCVDAARFQATDAHRAAAESERAALGIPVDAPTVLFSGKLLTKKRPDLLLRAFRRAAVPGARLVIAGDGELTESLRAEAAGLADVHFLPFANQAAMPARYLVGDVFALPSQGRHETWGLAVNEAMHLGRACVVSDEVGCQADLVPLRADGETEVGWVFRAGDELQLANRLRAALTLGRKGLAEAGERARRHAAGYTYEAASRGLHAALARVTRRGGSV